MLLLIKEWFVWLLNSEEIAEDWNDGLSYNKKYVNKSKNISIVTIKIALLCR